MVKTFKVPLITEDLLKYFLESRDKLRINIEKYEFSEINDFIDKNFTKKRLFHLHNHPTNELLFLTFCVLLRKLKKSFTTEYYDEMISQTLFSVHNTPIFEKDIEIYNLKWCKNFYKNSDFYDKPAVIPLIQ